MGAREKLELLDPNRYPRDLRILANQCAKLLNRVWEFKVSGDFSMTEGKVDETFEKVTVTLPRGGGADDSAIGPFHVFIRAKPGAEGAYQRAVYFGSKLFKSIDHTDTQTITGMLASLTPTPSDPGWKDVDFTGDDDVIWLEIAIGTWPAITSASIRSLGAEDEFDGGEVQHDGGSGSPTVYAQTKARIVLATISNDGHDRPVVDQLVRNHLRLDVSAMYGKKSDGSDTQVVAAVYPYPF